MTESQAIDSARRCAECKRLIRPSKLAATLHVHCGPVPGWMTTRSPLCSIACGAVAAVRLLEQVRT